MGSGRGLTTLSSGELFFVDTSGADLSVWILLGGSWETFVDDILCALVRPGDVVLDVGANMGYYSVKMAARVGDAGHVYSFEPNPRLQQFIRDSLNVNGFWTQATVIKAAAGEVAGTSTLTFDPGMPGGGTVGVDESGVKPGESRIDVQVVRIDDVIPPDLSVGLIKIDVEGFEPLVIGGMKGVMARSPDAAVVIEVAYAHWQAHGDPATILADFAGNRRIFRLFHDGCIEEVGRPQLQQALNPLWVSYMLLLPPNEARWEQVRRFVRGADGREENAGQASAPPESALPASLLSRMRRRLARLIAP